MGNKFFTKKEKKGGQSATSAEEMVQLLNAEKQWVIQMLNDNYQKPWFGKKADGTPCDIGAMTYEEVAFRLTELHWHAGRKQWREGMSEPHWFDVSFRERVFDW